VAGGVLIVLVVGSACTPASPPVPRTSATHVATTSAATSASALPVRTDLGPLLARFPALDGASSASWITWGLPGGGDRLSPPGPSTYWIQAVVHLGADRVAALADTHHAVPVAAPQLRAELAADLPAGEVLGGPGVDAAFTGDDWRATAYLLPATGDVVVLGIDD
jgi:hypothetical protein